MIRNLLLSSLLVVSVYCQSVPFPGPGTTVTPIAWTNGYAHRLVFTFNVHPASNLTAFPNLISGTYAGMADTAHGGSVTHSVSLNGQTVPADLIFTSDAAGTNLLSWEVESWNNTTGAIVVWVKSDRLAASDTLIYAWAGNSSVTTYQCTASATWDSNYKGVFHMGGGLTATAPDSTSGANTATATNITSTAGKMGNAASFPNTPTSGIGTGAGTFSTLTGDFTLEAWVNPGVSVPLYGGPLVTFRNDPTTTPSFILEPNGVIKMRMVNYGVVAAVTNTGVYSDSRWQHMVVTHSVSNSTDTIFYNGVSQTLTATSFTAYGSAISGLGIGIGTPGDYSIDAVIDEVRVSNVPRSTDWIAHEYRQQAQSSAWYIVGSWQ